MDLSDYGNPQNQAQQDRKRPEHQTRATTPQYFGQSCPPQRSDLGARMVGW